MTRYINADALRRAMYNEAMEKDSDMQKWDGGCWIRYKLFENVFDAQPTADVRENVRGEWIPINGAYQWKCSNCGEYIGGDADCTPYINKFCWNCGARMEGEEV